MTTNEIIERFGAHLLMCNNEYLLSFDDPSAMRQVPDLASRKQEIINELLSRGETPTVLKPTGVLDQLRQTVQKQHYNVFLMEGSGDHAVIHLRQVVAESPAAAHILGVEMAAEEGMVLHRVTKVIYD